MKEKVLLTNIQRFSLHDGPGIRTTVFLKGCSLRCPWCSNPENFENRIQDYVKNGVPGKYGKWMSCDELFNEVIKDKFFYGDKNLCLELLNINADNLESLPGGVTFSGGEALLQAENLERLFQNLKNESIHMAVETCLYVPENKLKIALKYIDLFYVDVKILDDVFCKSILQGSLRFYMNNLDVLFASDIPVVMRVPVIGGYTDGEYNRNQVVKLVAKYRPIKVELIKEHNLGIGKYQSIGMCVPDYNGVSDNLMEQYKLELKTTGITVQICKI